MGGLDKAETWRKYKIFTDLSLDVLLDGGRSLDTYSPQNMRDIAMGAMQARTFFEKRGARLDEEELREIDCRSIRRLLYFCLANGREEHAAAIAEGIITCPGIIESADSGKKTDERVAMAVGTLSGFAPKEGVTEDGKKTGFARKWLFGIISPEKPAEGQGQWSPALRAVVIRNLGYNPDFDTLKKTLECLTSEHREVRIAAVKQIEDLLCNMAFRGKEGDPLGSEVVEFLKKALIAFESAEHRVIQQGDAEVSKRFKMIIILTYNHILRDLHREAGMNETREMGLYHTILAQFVGMAPHAVGLLGARLRHNPEELGIDDVLDRNLKFCAIDALWKLGGNEGCRRKAISALGAYRSMPDQPEELKGEARRVARMLKKKMPSKPPAPPPRNSIAPPDNHIRRG